MIFARIESDEFKACGVFSDQEEAGDRLFDAAETACISMSPQRFMYSHKPFSEMTIEDDLDSHPMTPDVVVIL